MRIAVLLGVWLAAFPLLAEETLGFRTLVCRVVDETGRPVPGIGVRMVGLERDAPDLESLEDSGRGSGWNFVTDQAGRFTARFGKFHPYQMRDEQIFNGPGFGAFHLLVTKPGWAGGVSRLLLNLDEAELANYRPPKPNAPHDDRGEWATGEFAALVLTDTTLSKPLDIMLKRGLTLRGCILDTRGRPVPGQTVGINLDLHRDSHTGRGGEIFEQEATTDRHGRFQIHHIYPNTFTLSAGGDGDEPPYWIATRVRQKRSDRIVDEIRPRTGGARHPAVYERSIDLGITIAQQSPYRYFGRVTDEQGRGLVGVKVGLRVSLHDPPQTWADDHGGYGSSTATDARGNYSVQAVTRFVSRVRAWTDTLVGGVEADEDKSLAPGRYDFALRPKGPNE